MTIAGESAGSIAVSAQMASPLSKDLIAGAIGESGSIMGALPAVPLKSVEEQGLKFAASMNNANLAALRAMPTAQIFEAAGKQGAPRFSPTVDGYFLPEAPAAIFAAYQSVFGRNEGFFHNEPPPPPIFNNQPGY